MLLRSDNADQRLTEKGIKAGVVSKERKRFWIKKNEYLIKANQILARLKAKPSELKKFNLPITRTGEQRSPKEILASGEYKLGDLFEIWPVLKEIPNNLHLQLETDSRYEVYLKRQREDIQAYKKENKTRIPYDFDFNDVKGLSNESRDLLVALKPTTIAQASRIPGFTPTATLLLLRYLKRDNKEKKINEN